MEALTEEQKDFYEKLLFVTKQQLKELVDDYKKNGEIDEYADEYADENKIEYHAR